MKKLMCAAVGILLLNLTAYDVKNPALNPVEFQKPLSHGNLELVKDSKLNFAIVTDKNAEKKARGEKAISMAVNTLVQEIQKCTGVKPEVFDVTELEKAKKYPLRLLVGESALTKELGIDASKLGREGFLVKTFPGGIAIVGNDSSLWKDFNKNPLDYNGSHKATLWGAYDVLERFFGCRYYYPGPYGSLHPQVRNLIVSPVAYTDHPYFMNRAPEWFRWSLMGWSGKEVKVKDEWQKLLGPLTPAEGLGFVNTWRLANTSPFWAGHNPRPEKLLAAYPDKKETIFYRAPNGNQYYNEKQHIGNYFDVTKLEFADLLVESLKKYYASNGRDNDGWSSVNNTYIPFGQCDSEVPLPDMINNPTIKKENLITQKNIDRGFSYSDIYGRFYQYLANALKKEFPGKKMILLPYSNYTRAPLNPKWTLPDNVELRVCIFDFPAWTRNKEVVAKWQENMNEWYQALGKRPVASLWLYNIPKNPFARAIAPQMIGDIPKIFGKTLGNVDLFLDQYGDLEFFHYYADYAGVRAMWNPEFNAEAAVAEHWEPFYGKEAGAHLKAFHKVLYDSYMKYFMPNTKDKNPIYPPKVIDELESHLAKAAKAVKPGSVEEKRFQLFAEPWAKAFQSQRNRQSYERPVYGSHQLLSNENIAVDGTSSDAVWKKVKSMPTMDPAGSSEQRKFPSEIKIAWDKKGIYGLVHSPYPPLADEKKSIWDNSNVEIFISPGTKKENYYHYAVDPFNKRHLGTKELVPVDKPYNAYWKSPGFRSAVHTTKDGWTLEFFLPYDDLKVKAPNAYDNWHINIVTNKNSKPKEYSSSAMTLNNNHNLPMYGILKFLGKGE